MKRMSLIGRRKPPRQAFCVAGFRYSDPMNPEEILLGLTGILLLGLLAQWLAWRIHLPSILLLLLLGFAAGNFLSGFGPDELLGELLFPLVSLSVAIILFEGGLTLRFEEFAHIGGTVFKLISLGVLVTGAIGSLAAYFLVGLDLELSLLVGAILTVTGPTVIGPLLRHIRPSRSVGSVLEWESILIDPVGALLAVMIFQAIREGGLRTAPSLVALGVVQALAVGALTGVLGAALMLIALRRHWIPDHLQNPFALTVVLASFMASNHLHHESGLLTVTLMGIGLANQKWTPVRHIAEFKENLRVLLISSLFILLAARVRLSDLNGLTLGSAGFVAVLIFVARPLSVYLCTLGSDLAWKPRLFLAWMAPRGIVAAAVTSIFALRLVAEMDYRQAERLVPLVFLVIVCTVALYGLTAGPLARKLGLAEKDPQGALIFGADPFAVELGKALSAQGLSVLMVDNNFRKVAAARMSGLSAWRGNILADRAVERMHLGEIGRLLAMTSNDEANSLAAMHLLDLFSRKEIYQLKPQAMSGGRDGILAHDLSGRILFGEEITHELLERCMAEGWTVKTTPLTEQFDFQSFLERHGEGPIPLFIISSSGKMVPVTRDSPPRPAPGDTLTSFAPPES